MTTGALIFAYNNNDFDYVGMAAWAAANIRRHLDIPVAVITDRPTDLAFEHVILHQSSGEDSRWFGDINRRVPWNNYSRPDAFDLSPWTKTLLVDADYVVASNQLRLLLDADLPGIWCHRWASDATGMNDFRSLNHFGQYNMPMYWATVIMFDRSSYCEQVFACMKMVRENWRHYKNIYQDRSKTYRNDHALSIALGIANGHQPTLPAIPWSLVTVLPDHKLHQIDSDRYRIDFVKSDNRPSWIEITNQDFHAMGKQSLMGIIK